MLNSLLLIVEPKENIYLVLLVTLQPDLMQILNLLTRGAKFGVNMVSREMVLRRLSENAVKLIRLRANAEVKRVEEQVKAEARQAEAQVKVQTTSTLETCACGCRLTRTKMAKHLRTKMHLNLLAQKETTPMQALMDRLNKIESDMDKLENQMKDDVKHLEQLPTPSTTIGELDELSHQMDKDLKVVDRSFVMHELASVSRVRDYINHIESKVGRETVMVDEMLLKENLKKIDQIEESIQRESWTVTTNFDTIMLKQWLREASAHQADMNSEGTANTAIAPESMQLLTGELFSLPMYMGKKENQMSN
jgi:hypothetical protein